MSEQHGCPISPQNTQTCLPLWFVLQTESSLHGSLPEQQGSFPGSSTGLPVNPEVDPGFPQLQAVGPMPPPLVQTAAPEHLPSLGSCGIAIPDLGQHC